MAQLVYTLIPGSPGFDFSKPNENLNGCAVYANCYGVSGSCGSGELGGFSTNTGGSHLSIGTFNGTLFFTNRVAQWLMNTTSMEYMLIDVITGTDFNGGERPNNFGESLYLQCVTGGSSSSTKIANSGKDGGYTFPDVDAGGAWTTVTVNIPASNRGQFYWRFYATAGSPEFEGQGGVYANNQNAGDRFAISRIRIYGDVPTNLSFFRGNDNSPSTEIFPEDPIIFGWNTKLGSFSTCTSGTIYQVVGGTETAIYNIPGGQIDAGTWVLVPGPTSQTTYRIRVNGNSGPAQQDLLAEMLQEDTNPDQVQFDSIQAASTNTVYESDTVTITGIGTTISCNITNGAELSINGGGWVTSGNINEDDTIKLRMTSSSAFSTQKQTSITIGNLSTTWKVTTASEPANLPNPFSFNTVNDADLDTMIESNSVTITGLSGPVTVLSPTNANFESKVASGSWDSNPKTIGNGQSLSLRTTTSANLNDTAFTTVIVGQSAPVQWTVKNKGISDDNPDYFNFTDVIEASVNTLTQSPPISITGLNVPTNIETTNGAEIQINGNSWVPSPTILNNNDIVRVRILSSANPGGIVESEITIGNTPVTKLTDTWKVTTTAFGDVIPDDFFFIDKEEQIPGSYIVSNMVLMQGITSPSPLSVSNGEASINGGAWVTTGSVNNGDTVQLRMLTPSSVSTSKSISITVG